MNLLEAGFTGTVTLATFDSQGAEVTRQTRDSPQGGGGVVIPWSVISTRPFVRIDIYADSGTSQKFSDFGFNDFFVAGPNYASYYGGH